MNDKLIKDIKERLERYQVVLEKTLESGEGNMLTRKALKIDLKKTKDIIMKLNEI